MHNSNHIAIFHPSSELYGADRIMVIGLEALPQSIKKTVYLKFDGPLISYIKDRVKNVEVIVRPDLPIIYRAIFTPRGIVRYIKDWFSFLRFLRQANQKNNYYSAYVNTLSCSFLLPILSILGIKNYTHVHEIIERPKVIGFLTTLMCWLFTQKVICVSDAVQSNLINYLAAIRKKSVVLHNGIAPIIVPDKDLEDKIEFYLFGRIKKEKGQWFLIEALKEIPDKVKNKIRVTIMGGTVSGQEYLVDDLMQKIDAYQLTNTVQIKGFTNNIGEAMAQADVCIVPSLMKDPFPTTVLEAMSAGKPVIATNHGGAKEALNGSNCGFLIAPGETMELSKSIEYLVNNTSEINNMGKASKKRFESVFTKTHFKNKWLNFNQINGFV